MRKFLAAMCLALLIGGCASTSRSHPNTGFRNSLYYDEDILEDHPELASQILKRWRENLTSEYRIDSVIIHLSGLVNYCKRYEPDDIVSYEAIMFWAYLKDQGKKQFEQTSWFIAGIQTSDGQAGGSEPQWQSLFGWIDTTCPEAHKNQSYQAKWSAAYKKIKDSIDDNYYSISMFDEDSWNQILEEQEKRAERG